MENSIRMTRVFCFSGSVVTSIKEPLNPKDFLKVSVVILDILHLELRIY